MTLDDATRRLAQVLRAENDALAVGDTACAALFLAEKEAAAAALRAALPGTVPNPALAATLQELAAENGVRLRQAIDVQSRIIEMVARAARLAEPGPLRYGAGGAPASSIAAVALTVRA